MIYEDDVLAYLEHAGVKGMKWGNRGGRKAHPRSAAEQKRRRDTFNKVKSSEKLAAAVGVGALAAVTILEVHGKIRLRNALVR